MSNPNLIHGVSVNDLQSLLGEQAELDGDFDLFDDDKINDVMKEQNEKSQGENRDTVRAYAQIFGTEQGKKVLEDLFNRTLRESVFMPERDNPNILGHIREGQNTIVRYIIQRINQGRQLKQSETEDE